MSGNAGQRQFIDALREIYLSILGVDCPDTNLENVIESAKNGDEPFLISGERGAGKELLARALHLAGPRAHGPFASISARGTTSKVFSELLFGQDGKSGAMARAKGGSLLIHGAGEIPLEIQKLLTGIIRGSKSDVRFFFTTRKDLHGAMLREEFNEELWDLFEYSSAHVPPLRERPRAVPILAARILDRYAARLSSPARGLHSTAKERLMEHDWPGNLFDLERVILLALARAAGPLIMAEDLVELGAGSGPSPLDLFPLDEILARKLKPLVNSADETLPGELYALVLSAVEKPLIAMVMEKTGGNKMLAAKILGLHRNTLRKKLKELNICLAQ